MEINQITISGFVSGIKTLELEKGKVAKFSISQTNPDGKSSYYPCVAKGNRAEWLIEHVSTRDVKHVVVIGKLQTRKPVEGTYVEVQVHQILILENMKRKTTLKEDLEDIKKPKEGKHIKA